MIITRNIRRFDNVPFEEYLKFPQYSHSFLKHEKNGVVEAFVKKDNMQLGSLVDDILTDGNVNMAHPLYPYARDMAHKIRTTFGDIIKCFHKQVSYTAEMEYNNFVMPVKGRLDFLLPKHAVIDLKLTQSKQLRNLISYMGYGNQGWNYCKLAEVNDFYLMIHSIPLKKTEIIKLDCSSNSNLFFEEKIEKFGSVKLAA